ncbi:LysR family transcriptional regulator [Sphingomonas naphthae]|uniref:LysR family transcriptional regulator n=1 Tax=Sphingomonas naphthae TaxID=1813468 RepID=A0ABY7TH79_9SPHN|nr:LysR family transcriptional regulator [Sphingomonas naphthae]WCT72592.1 LysR family transcriptional regulator [Sphingomonas naphthae]
MLNGVSLDQLRTFVASADGGSFSAAGRTLGRAQSVVSQTIANLEGQLGVALFERIGRYPVLTAQGSSLLDDARRIVTDADQMRARARSLAEGLEAELAIVVDVMFPQPQLTAGVLDFKRTFPSTPLRLHVEALGAVAQLVLDGVCSMGITGTLPFPPPSLAATPLMTEQIVTVVAPGSPLARSEGVVPLRMLLGQTQLVLTDRSCLTDGTDYGVQGKDIWRLSDLSAKLAFLRAGLGWGHMPRWLVEEDIGAGRLVPIVIEGPAAGIMPFQAVYRSNALPGPAGRWLLDRLSQAS